MKNADEPATHSFNDIINLVKNLNKNKKKVKKEKSKKVEELNYIQKFNNSSNLATSQQKTSIEESNEAFDNSNQSKEDKNTIKRESMILSNYSGKEIGKEKFTVFGYENNRLSSEFNFDLTNIYSELNNYNIKDNQLGLIIEEKEKENQLNSICYKNCEESSQDESDIVFKERVSRHKRGMNPYLNQKNSKEISENNKQTEYNELNDNKNIKDESCDFFNIVEVDRNYVNKNNYNSKVADSNTTLKYQIRNNKSRKFIENNEFLQIDDENFYNKKEIEESIKTDDENDQNNDLGDINFKKK
jgi:hypothetical protein